MSTVMVTNMPFWCERVGAPRTLAVELPFGHLLGQPGDRGQQRRVILQALDVLVEATAPGTIVHSTERWPGSSTEAMRASHPRTPPPIGAGMARKIRAALRGLGRERR